MYLIQATAVRRCLLLSFLPYSPPSPYDKLIYNVYNIYIYIYQWGETPLHVAARGGHGKIVETLVEAKADVCAQDSVSVLKETRLDADRGMR
jgi:hypothetical protein